MTNNQRKSPSRGPVVDGAAALAAAPAPVHRSVSWKRRNDLIGYLFMLPAAIFVLIFYVYPIVNNVVMSFQRYTAKSYVTGEAPFIGFGNFERLFGNPDFRVAVLNTVVFTVGSLFFQFTIGLAIARLFQPEIPAERLPAQPFPAALAGAYPGFGRSVGAPLRHGLWGNQLRPALTAPDRRAVGLADQS